MATAIPMEEALSASQVAETQDGLEKQVRRGRLLYKLLAVFLTLSILPLLVTGFLLVRAGDRAIQKQIISAKTGIAQKVAASVTSYIDDKRNTLQIVHKSSDFLSMNAAREQEILSTVMNAYPMFMRLQVMDLKGREVAAVDRMGDTRRRDTRIRQEALRATRGLTDYMGPVSRSPEGYPQIVIGVPIEKIPGRPLGTLLGVVNLIDLSSLVKGIAIDQMGYVFIVDPARKQLVAHPDIQTLLSADPPPEVRAAALAPEGSRQGALEFKDQAGHKFLATYADVPKLGWRVFVQQPVEEAYGASRQMRRQVGQVLWVVLLATLGLGFLISQWITRRVRQLQSAVEQVAEGHFDITPVPTSNDEFGSLTQAFRWMAAMLKEKTASLVSAQRELQTWNIELERRVDERAKRLKETQDQLIAQEKLAVLGQMASVVGHELRNPLAVMNNSVYLLKGKLMKTAEMDGGDPKIAKHLSVIESEIVKSNTIIRDVLDFARNRTLNAAPRKIDELVTKALERIQIPPEVKVDRSLTLGDLEVPVDEDELRQVLVNLMENACQAMVSGGRLSVGTKAYNGSQIEISIGDTGCGIPQEHLNKIFAPFFTTKSRGTGLGLAVVKKIIDRHQGVLEVQSVVGEGTTFRIRLPRQTKAS